MQRSYFLIGEILKPQGINGEVKLKTHTEDLDNLCDVEKLYTKNGEEYTEIEVEYARIQAGDAIFKFVNCNDRNKAETLRGTLLYIDREDATPLEYGEYYISDIIGFVVQDNLGNNIGELKDVLNHGASDIYVLKDGKKEILLPALKRLLLNTDLEKGIITVDSEVLAEVAVYTN